MKALWIGILCLGFSLVSSAGTRELEIETPEFTIKNLYNWKKGILNQKALIGIVLSPSAELEKAQSYILLGSSPNTKLMDFTEISKHFDSKKYAVEDQEVGGRKWRFFNSKDLSINESTRVTFHEGRIFKVILRADNIHDYKKLEEHFRTLRFK